MKIPIVTAIPRPNAALKAFLGIQLVVVLALAAYLAAVLTPATRWYEPTQLIVSSGPDSEIATVTLTRAIHQSFPGEYVVEVRWVESRGKLGDPGYAEVGALACYGGDRVGYKGGLTAPHTSSLRAFAADSPTCTRLPPGTFYATACWTVLRPFFGLVPAKQVCISSDAFRITGTDERG